MTHTPGPWELNTLNGRLPDVRRLKMPHGEADTYVSVVKVAASTEIVCKLDFGYGRGAVDEANARLMAASADLFDAMRVILEGFEKGIFVRNIDHDHEPMWLLGIAVQIAALGKGQRAIDKVLGGDRQEAETAP